MTQYTNPAGPRDAAYQFQMAAEKAEWLASQVRIHGSMPIYDALTILTEQAATFRALEAAAQAATANRVEAIREMLG